MNDLILSNSCQNNLIDLCLCCIFYLLWLMVLRFLIFRVHGSISSLPFYYNSIVSLLQIFIIFNHIITLIFLELYGTHWEDIAVCAGLVSTATIILLVVFIPKVKASLTQRSSPNVYLGVPDDCLGGEQGGVHAPARHSHLHPAH